MREEKILAQINESDNQPICIRFLKNDIQLYVGVVNFQDDGVFELQITNKRQKGKKILLDYAFSQKYGYEMQAAKFVLTEYKFVDKQKCVVLMPIKWRRSSCFHIVEYSQPSVIGSIGILEYVDDKKYHMFVKGIDNTLCPGVRDIFRLKKDATKEQVEKFKNDVTNFVKLSLDEKEKILKYVEIMCA